MTSLPRASGAELMDEPDADPRELARSLADLRRVNRWLGGTRAVLGHLGRLCADHPRPEYSVLDVGTGSADIPIAIAHWARRRGLRIRLTATDLHQGTLEEARRRTVGLGITIQPADALALPFADRSFDFALICTALHHFEGDQAVRALRELGRVSRIAALASDLTRSRPALLGAELLAATLWRSHPITRHDGPLSVRRAFTPGEMQELAAAAGLRARVVTHPVFRAVLIAEHAADV